MIQSVKKINNLINNQLGGYEIIMIDGTKISVPLDENNRHYQEILEWVADGNTIQEAD
tara:strand:+ start:155 stop:328 length:174 start_codon:yes stop_codon:yes gene_type:complete